MSLSRRSFVQTLGAGAAGAWIGGRGLEGARFSLQALEAAEQTSGSGARLLLSSNENPLGTAETRARCRARGVDQDRRPLSGCRTR